MREKNPYMLSSSEGSGRLFTSLLDGELVKKDAVRSALRAQFPQS